MSGCFLGLALLFYFIGVMQLLRGEVAQRQPVSGLASKPLPRASRSAAPGAAGAATSAAAASTSQGGAMVPQKLTSIRVGERIRVRHPQQGELTVYVMGRIEYQELWQTRPGAQSPWVPTGNGFLGFWLETNIFLLNWQNRFYLLDENTPISDADIQRDFLPHAKKFAASNQTAEVLFAYPPAMWKIEDIGKFSVQTVEGEGLRFRPGAVGRFIHASGDGGRALVLEDYEAGGGGQDTVWTGYHIEEADIQPA